MKELSEPLRSLALTAESNELGWELRDIGGALVAIGRSGHAILGGHCRVVENGKRLEPYPGAGPDLNMWDTEHRKTGETWQDYCDRSVDESVLAINTLKSEDVDASSGLSLFVCPVFVGEFDVRALVPRNKHDHARAAAAIAAGYPAVEPILPDLLVWMQDMNWPVARDLAPFLAHIGTPLIPHIKKIFETDDEIWKYWMMCEIMMTHQEVASAFRDDLVRIAYSPTALESEAELDEPALSVLEQYGWSQ